MKKVRPIVIKIGETRVDPKAMAEVMGILGVSSEYIDKFVKTRGTDGQALIEFAGRLCYESYQPQLNPNVTKIRENPSEYFSNVLSKGDGSIMEHPQISWALLNISRVCCYSADTEVLTSEGWKPWPTVRGDELFATMTQEGDLTYGPAAEHYSWDYEGPMYEVRSQQIDLLVTPNHRMWVQGIDTQAYRRGEASFSIRPAIEILHKRMKYQKGFVEWWGKKSTKVEIPETCRRYLRADRPGQLHERTYDAVIFESQAFARFLGFFLAEGYLGTDTSINLVQNSGPNLDEMMATIRSMGRTVANYASGTGHSRVLRFKCVPLYDWLKENCGHRAVNKRVPQTVQAWSKDLITTFMDALVKGDGNIHKANGHRVLYTSSKQLADHAQILALKMGLAANIRVDDRIESHGVYTGTVIRKTRPNYIVSFLQPTSLFALVNGGLTGPHTNRFINEEGFEDRLVSYTGKVYCVKVKHGLLYVRRNGKPCWSGNSHEIVRHRVGTAISQESLRYVRPRELKFWIPEELAGEQKTAMAEAVEQMEKAYRKLEQTVPWDKLNMDSKKRLTSALRRILPDGLATNMIWTANHRTLRWVIEVRTDPVAEVEIRMVFDQIAQICKRDYPAIYQDMIRTELPDGTGSWRPTLRSKV